MLIELTVSLSYNGSFYGQLLFVGSISKRLKKTKILKTKKCVDLGGIDAFFIEFPYLAKDVIRGGSE